MDSTHERGRARGPWHQRSLTWFFSVLLGVLVFWLLGFIVNDIGTWPGPDYGAVERRFVNAELAAEEETLRVQLEEVGRAIDLERQRQEVLRDGTDNASKTMDQLLEIQRSNNQRGVETSEIERTALAEAQRLFLENQRAYQAGNEQVSRLTEQRVGFETRLRVVQGELETQRVPARLEYQRLVQVHQWKLAALKLSVLVPLLALSVFVFLRNRQSLYAPVLYAFGTATLLKVLLVMHQHFPRRYFKYVLILAALGLVVAILVYLLRSLAHPRRELLLRQYREAYEHFFCPVCNFPIRRGPLRYVFWTRRSLKRLPAPAESQSEEGPYTCPSCGTLLFEECTSCHGIRHSLLPACSLCGAEKSAEDKSKVATLK